MEQYVMDIRLQQWAKIVAEANSNSGSKIAWLREHNITKDQYYYWQKKVRNHAAKSLNLISCDDQPIVEVPIMPGNPNPDTYATGAVIHIGSVTVDVNNNASPDFLSNLGRMIKNAQ